MSHQLVQQVVTEYDIHEQHKLGNFTQTYHPSYLDHFLSVEKILSKTFILYDTNLN